ncbi:recombinase family protein [Mesorhizobium sp.]|uniref:recombinase family protein n=1 Tax=Mesorhizobium sp. TaxID=1871066 RepID=UPI000FE5DDB6|nr:recombinase family protein [Mesorhizobium sp.]RWD65290.1 MAG: hypothetical protein EOS37_26235 [Mesorhizobium sp.]
MKSLDILHSHSYTENVETTATQHPVAYSYIRWSSAIQGEGDSLRRQKQMAEQWCQRNGVKLADDKIMVDAGVSAYRGKNLKEGAISAFVTAAKAGYIPKGSFLLVESLDRLSRMRTVEVLRIFLDIIHAGVVLVTLGDDGDDERIFRWDDVDEEDLREAIGDMRGNHRFSQKLSRRIRESWEDRTNNARQTGKPIPGNLPAWLYYDANGDLQMEEAKVAIVQWIFDMCISGLGLTAIAQTLNEADVPPLALHKRKKIKNRSNFWTITSVAYLLRYKAVYGDYHPNKADPIPGIFPVIVSKEDFYRAEAARGKRYVTTRGRNGKGYTNMFKGIAKCHYCGEAMNIKNGRNERTPNKPFQFRCKGVGVKTCKHTPWNYDVFETAFLSFVREIDLTAIINGGSESKLAEITRQLQALHGQRMELERNIKTFMDLIRENRTGAKRYASAIDEDQAKLDAINQQAQVLENERNKIQVERRASSELLPIELPRDAKVRAKVAEHIRTVVESVTLKRDGSSRFGSTFTVHFAGGGSRSVYVDYTNPRHPFAVTNSDKSKMADIIPKDAATAAEMREYVLQDIGQEFGWLADHATTDESREAVKDALGKFKDVADTLQGQARELGLIK